MYSTASQRRSDSVSLPVTQPSGGVVAPPVVGSVPPSRPVTVECYARASMLMAPVDSTIETLRAYERRGVVDDLMVETWPDEVSFTGEVTDHPAVEQYRRFKTWAKREGVLLKPAFDFRERTTPVDDRSEVVLRLPVLCVAVSVGGRLELVAPHQSDYSATDVFADLDAVDRSLPPAVTGASPPSATHTPEQCPLVCGAPRDRTGGVRLPVVPVARDGDDRRTVGDCGAGRGSGVT